MHSHDSSKVKDRITVRRYGDTGAVVALLHGGPGAPGHMAAMARALAPRYRILEPLQRLSGEKPLTVATHVRDLHDVLCSLAHAPVHLVGSSWGAMLALVHAAEHPEQVRSVVAIGCGTFDERTRDLYRSRLAERMGAAREQVERLDFEDLDANEMLRRKAELLLPAYSNDLITTDLEYTAVDARGNRETWTDMLRLQTAGVYPQAFERITAPVLMLHGALDPHPGPATRDCLALYIRHLDYHEWSDCGHYPWLERVTGELFYGRLNAWVQGIEATDAHDA